ncbi:hypothetical protein fHeYen902_194 [Yersinia phage fHe-Yen9-02]|nr:hypothetical protein fHeYen902_194 [Yersinia phage fHe-Yen9-02]
MGCYKEISYTEFPAQSRNIGEKVVVLDSHGNVLLASVLRRDMTFPFRTIWQAKRPDGRSVIFDNRSLKAHPEVNVMELEIGTSGTYEGRKIEVIFQYDTNNITPAVCIFDRGPITLFKLLEGPNAGMIVHANECQYSPVRA